MSEQGRTALKRYFQTGDVPTESEFSDLIDSMVNKTDDAVPMIYRFIANQTGTSDPTITVIHNSLPDTVQLVWSYNNTGDYRLEANSAIFLAGKTYLGGGGLDPDNFGFTKAVRSSDTEIIINSFDASIFPIETLADSKMVNVMFEIIVYP